jgi:hypothetical protein
MGVRVSRESLIFVMGVRVPGGSENTLGHPRDDFLFGVEAPTVDIVRFFVITFLLTGLKNGMTKV